MGAQYQPYPCDPVRGNVFGEETFKPRVTFGAGSALTFRGKDVLVEKLTTTTFKVTFPRTYGEITDFSYGWAKASGVAPLDVYISDQSQLSVDGTITLTTVASNTAGTPTAPASGDEVFLTFGVSNDVLNDSFTG